jgi:hypothetical protein
LGDDRILASKDELTDWKMAKLEIPSSKDGEDRATLAFVDGFSNDVQVLRSTFSKEERTNDYSGRWPVYTYGIPPR